ncbi:MAG: rane-bound lytic murein transglycosylase [Campylobacterota bacterium]|nr:rane-bound lytic murein transglycosylase [Campylobacterota bacterium]
MNILRTLLLLFALACTSLSAQPSESAINASLSSIGSAESLDDIRSLSTINEDYKTGYKGLYKRYKDTQEEHQKIAKKFEEANIPLFFSLIPYCESNFKSDAYGHGTAGLWQFMAQSGRTYGLKIEKGNDQRTDVCHSTDAAIRYIKDLKSIFKEWYLVDFAYGMGELKLQRLIRKNGSKKISVLLKDPEFPKGTKNHFAKTLLLDAAIHHTKPDNDTP